MAGEKSFQVTFSNVKVGDARPSDHYVAADWQTITLAPLWVFELVAGADKNVDEKEEAAFVAALASPQEGELARFVFADLALNLAEVRAKRARDTRPPFTGLGDVQALLASYPDQEAAGAFRKALADLGAKIAEASGGFLGLGSKTSAKEAHVLDQVRGIFRLPP